MTNDISAQAHQLIAQLNTSGLKGKDKSARNKAIAALVAMGDEAIPYLVAELQNNDSAIVKGCIWSLVKIGNPSVIPNLTRVFIEGKEFENSHAQSALVAFGHNVTPFFLECLTAYPHQTWVRYYAIQALGDLGDVTAISALMALKNGPEFVHSILDSEHDIESQARAAVAKIKKAIDSLV